MADRMDFRFRMECDQEWRSVTDQQYKKNDRASFRSNPRDRGLIPVSGIKRDRIFSALSYIEDTLSSRYVATPGENLNRMGHCIHETR